MTGVYSTVSPNTATLAGARSKSISITALRHLIAHIIHAGFSVNFETF
jgi:hypothetical protein